MGFQQRLGSAAEFLAVSLGGAAVAIILLYVWPVAIAFIPRIPIAIIQGWFAAQVRVAVTTRHGIGTGAGSWALSAVSGTIACTVLPAPRWLDGPPTWFAFGLMEIAYSVVLLPSTITGGVVQASWFRRRVQKSGQAAGPPPAPDYGSFQPQGGRRR